MRIGAVILAAGRGARFGGDKVRARLSGKAVWRWSFDAFKSHPKIDKLVVVCPADLLDRYREEIGQQAIVVEGGSSRQESSWIGVQQLSDCDLTLVHDAARPLVTSDLIDRVIEETLQTGAAGPAVSVVDTLRTRSGELVDRSNLVAMQTPQGARTADLLRAHAESKELVTDDLALLQSIGIKPAIIEGEPQNFKITTEDDLAKARGIIGFRETRTGLGYDVHRFSSDPTRPLVVGGVLFSGTGLEGHSDADALLHAVVDSILGAASLGDIGVHFPNTDPQWKDRASIEFVKYATELIYEAGWKVVNIDATVIAERPKVMPQAAEIRSQIAHAVGCPFESVSVKATTNEKLGSIGRTEGLAAFAVATLTEA